LAGQLAPHTFLDILRGDKEAQKEEKLFDWTYICYLKTTLFTTLGANIQDLDTLYKSFLEIEKYSPSSSSPQQSLWKEKFLAYWCKNAYQQFKEKLSSFDGKDVDTSLFLRAFRSWSKSSKNFSTPPKEEGDLNEAEIYTQRRLSWKFYYEILSQIILYDYPYHFDVTSDLSKEQTATATQSKHSQLYKELLYTQDMYEVCLFHSLTSADPNSSKVEVANWIELVMSTWIELNSKKWKNEDLGDGGKEALSRRVLKTLNRVLDTTIKPPKALPYIFTLHVSLKEFDKAGAALETYFALGPKMVDVQSNSNPEPDALGDQEVLWLQNIATSVEVICEYGEPDHVRNLHGLINKLTHWYQAASTADTWIVREDDPTHVAVSSAVFKTIGVHEAAMARLCSSDECQRLRKSAIGHLNSALRQPNPHEDNPSIFYSMAKVCAEDKQVESAITWVKKALSYERTAFGNSADDDMDLEEETELKFAGSNLSVKCWALLALLLVAKDDYDTALKAGRIGLKPYNKPAAKLKDISWFEREDMDELKEIVDSIHLSMYGFLDEEET
jgi:cargo-transport protein YPP1